MGIESFASGGFSSLGSFLFRSPSRSEEEASKDAFGRASSELRDSLFRFLSSFPRASASFVSVDVDVDVDVDAGAEAGRSRTRHPNILFLRLSGALPTAGVIPGDLVHQLAISSSVWIAQSTYTGFVFLTGVEEVEETAVPAAMGVEVESSERIEESDTLRWETGAELGV